jgi:hypothetical protein
MGRMNRILKFSCLSLLLLHLVLPVQGLGQQKQPELRAQCEVSVTGDGRVQVDFTYNFQQLRQAGSFRLRAQRGGQVLEEGFTSTTIGAQAGRHSETLYLSYEGSEPVLVQEIVLELVSDRSGNVVSKKLIPINKQFPLAAREESEEETGGSKLLNCKVVDDKPSTVVLTVNYIIDKALKDYPGGFRITGKAMKSDGQLVEKTLGLQLGRLTSTRGAARVLIKYMDLAPVPTDRIQLQIIGIKEAEADPAKAEEPPPPADVLCEAVFPFEHTWRAENDIMGVNVAQDTEKMPDTAVVFITYAFVGQTKDQPKLVRVIPTVNGKQGSYWRCEEVEAKRTPLGRAMVKVNFVGDSAQGHEKSVYSAKSIGLMVQIIDETSKQPIYEEHFEHEINWKFGNYIKIAKVNRASQRDLTVNLQVMVDAEAFSSGGGRSPLVLLRLYDENDKKVETGTTRWERVEFPTITRVGEWISGKLSLNYVGYTDIYVKRIEVALVDANIKDLLIRSMDVDMLWPTTIIGVIPATSADVESVDLDGKRVFVRYAEGLCECKFDDRVDVSAGRTGRPREGTGVNPLEIADIVAVSGMVIGTKDGIPIRMQDCTFRWLGQTTILEVHTDWRGRAVPNVTVTLTDDAGNTVSKKTDARGTAIWQPVPRELRDKRVTVGATPESITRPDNTVGPLLNPETKSSRMKDGYNELTFDLEPVAPWTATTVFVRLSGGKCLNSEDDFGDELYADVNIWRHDTQITIAHYVAMNLGSGKEWKDSLEGGDEFFFLATDHTYKQIQQQQVKYLGEASYGLTFVITVVESDEGSLVIANKVWNLVDTVVAKIPVYGQIAAAVSEFLRAVVNAIGDDDDELASFSLSLTPEELLAICDLRNFSFFDKEKTEDNNWKAVYFSQNKDLWGGCVEYSWRFKGTHLWSKYEYDVNMNIFVIPAWSEMTGWK